MGSGPVDLTQNFADPGKIIAIHGTQKLGPQYGHIFRVTGTDKVVAFVSTGAAPYTDIHKHLKRPKSFEAFLEALVDDLLPVIRQLPVVFHRIPWPGIGQTEIFDTFRISGITVHPLANIERGFHPIRIGRSVIDLDQLFRFG